jgi:predicted hydrocarbon binding protein
MLATVDALLPLSLLEAVRDVDTPEELADAEFVDELRNKRLGLSDTVYTQIKRYTEAVRRNQRTAQEEAVALARLIGRRPDAEAVLRAAGRYLAREAYMTISPVTRGLVRVLPSIVSRPMALRQVRRIARRYLNGNVRRVGTHVLLEIPRSITVGVAAGNAGCAFYEATLRELLRLLVGTTGSVEHTRCEGRGEGACEWRADWRGADGSRKGSTTG